MRPALLLLGCWLLVVASASSAPTPINNGTGEASPSPPLRCGHVYDGDKLIYDIDYQVSTKSITANWFGFENPGLSIDRYEWAVVSEKLADNGFFVEAKKRCRSHVDITPDILDWTSAGTDTSALSDSLNMEAGKRYFILVRAVYSNGQESITNSDGVKIVKPNSDHSAAEEQDEVKETRTISLEDLAAAAETTSSEKATRSVESTEATESTEQLSCSIDILNACRRGRNGVGALLTELYGPPVFIRDPLVDSNVDVLYSIQSSDNDGGLTDGEKAGIIVACIVAFLIFFLPLYCLKGKGKSNKFQTNPNRTENIENI